MKRLDVRKMTLLNLYKAHAYVTLKLLAEEMGLDGMGPERLRREVLAFGDRVEVDPQRRVMVVYARRIPRARAGGPTNACAAGWPITWQRSAGMGCRTVWSSVGKVQNICASGIDANTLSL